MSVSSGFLNASGGFISKFMFESCNVIIGFVMTTILSQLKIAELKSENKQTLVASEESYSG